MKEAQRKVETFRAFHGAFHSRLGTLSSVYLSAGLGRQKKSAAAPCTKRRRNVNENQLITARSDSNLPTSNDG